MKKVENYFVEYAKLVKNYGKAIKGFKAECESGIKLNKIFDSVEEEFDALAEELSEVEAKSQSVYAQMEASSMLRYIKEVMEVIQYIEGFITEEINQNELMLEREEDEFLKMLDEYLAFLDVKNKNGSRFDALITRYHMMVETGIKIQDIDEDFAIWYERLEKELRAKEAEFQALCNVRKKFLMSCLWCENEKYDVETELQVLYKEREKLISKYEDVGTILYDLREEKERQTDEMLETAVNGIYFTAVV